MMAWELRDLVVRYGSRTAVDGVSVDALPGEAIGLVGPSGSGKTSLVRAGLGLIPRSSGTVRLFGQDATGWTERDWAPHRRRVQLLFQDPAAMLHPSMSIGLLLMDSAALHQPSEDPEAAARQILGVVGLAQRFDARPHELSGGERRRAGVARILLTRPKLLVVDEPTVGLDAEHKANLLQILVDNLDHDCAVVLISHDLPVITWACQRLLVLDRGRVVEQLDVADLERAEHPRTRALIEASGVLEAS